MKEILNIIFLMILILAGTYYGLAMLNFHFTKIACERMQEATELPTKIIGDKWVYGCFILVDGKWIEGENYGMGFTQNFKDEAVK